MGRYNTFVVRIWSNDGRMHGTIQHTRSRERLAFVEMEEILAFIRSHLDVAEENTNNQNAEINSRKTLEE